MIETVPSTTELGRLYLSDETAWLEETAERIALGAYDELDYENLREYLTDMARRDRREVMSRLIILIAHHLKWQYQPAQRSVSWRTTIAEQRRELAADTGTGVLKKHVEDILAEAYAAAVEKAAIETGLAESTFPGESGLTARQWIALPVPTDSEE